MAYLKGIKFNGLLGFFILALSADLAQAGN